MAFALLAMAGAAIAYQVNTSTSGTGPVVKTYPSTLTASYTLTGGVNQTAIQNPTIALNGVGGITSAQMTPAIVATTNAIRLDVDALGCGTPPLRCSNRGTLRIDFGKAVTNPVLHLSGLGGNNGSVDGSQTTYYSTSLNLTSFTGPSSSVTLNQTNSNGNLTVSSSEIRATSTTGGTSCTTAPLAGCGSVRVTGTVTSVTFRMDLIIEGNYAPWVNSGNPIDAFTLTTTVDEDFGDAPAGYQASAVASHIVGGLYLGASITADNTTTLNGNPQATSPIANATASTDASDNGVTFPTLVRSTATNIDVAVSGTGGRLQGWIDWADDGNFSTAGDRIATDAVDGGAGDGDGTANGIIRVAVTPPVAAAITPTIARFRISTTAGIGINGAAPDGEVEDYEVTVLPQRADLSLTKAVSNASPSNGSTITYTLTATSAASPTSNATATGITVQDSLPAGVTYVSSTGTGTYTSGTGVWAVGSLAPGASAMMQITATVTAASGTVTNVAQISASSLTDPDSTVNNGVTTEDDYASVPFTVSSVLAAPVCSVGTTNQIITNGGFSSGTGPSWTNWTANAIWTGTGDANVNNDTTTGSLAQSGLTGLKVGPSAGGGSVVQLSAWWRNAGPAVGSLSSQLRLMVAGTEYARITTDPSGGTSASVTYYNGASGNVSTMTEFASTGWRINIPTTVLNTGSISFDFVPNGVPSDDFMVDNVSLYTCTTIADLSLTKTVSNPTPNLGDAISYTLRVTNDVTSAATATGITVQDTLPAGFSFVSAAGTGTYDNGTGVWSVGSLAPNSFAELTINGTVNSDVTGGVAVTNIAQVTASSAPDPDSTVNNAITTEDDYATVPFTVPGVYNCPVGNTGTGSGFAVGGTGAFQDQIFWLDWSCGGVGGYPKGATINKSWNAGDGLIVTAQVSNITAALSTYATGSYGGDVLPGMYPGVNPIGLRGFKDSEDPQFRLNFSGTLNGLAVPLNYVTADAESSDGSNEALAATVTGGTNWSLIDQSGALTVALATNSFTMSDVGNAGNGSAVVMTNGNTPQIDATITQGGLQAMAFGVFTPFDFSDAPLTGTSYASANHRTISAFDLGAAFTNEGAAYDSPTATGDADDGITLPAGMTAGVPVTISVNAPNVGYLSAWFDWNDDGDFADAGEKVANDIVNGGAGDTDGAANGIISFSVTPTTASTQTFARFRLSSKTGAPSSGLHGFGEIEDYQLVILNKAVLSLAKSSSIWNDSVNPLFNLPGNDVTYAITAGNTTNGQPDTNSVWLFDAMPAQMTFYNGDADGAGPGTNPVNFANNGSGLTFNYATDVAYSNAASAPASFAACTYTPTAGYDPNVKFICFNPKGTMAAKTGAATPSMTFSFRSKIK